MKLRIVSLFCALILLFSLAACGNKSGNETVTTEKNTGTSAGTASGEVTTEAPETPADPVAVRVFTLNGTTGFGMAKLMEDAANGAFETETYTVSVKTDATEVNAALISGDVDIAALPTNAASVLYNKTKGGVKILAINTLGCLHLISNNGTEIKSIADLAGKTVYVPAQNPYFLFTHICEANGLKIGTDVTVLTTFAAPADLQTRFVQGAKITGSSDEVALAVLPEPIVTAATNAAKKNGVTVTDCLDLTVEWDKLEGHKDTLVQGCVVVRTAFLEAHPEAVAHFMTAYRASVEYVNTNVVEAAALIVKHGIFASEPVAKSAIPRCNIAYLEGAAMKTAMQKYLQVLLGVNATAIGGALPADDFYFIAS